MKIFKVFSLAAVAMTAALSVQAQDVTVNFSLPSELAALKDGDKVAEVTVDREYYNIYWTIRCEQDADFFHGGSCAAAQAGAGTYDIIAFTPSALPIELNGGYVYTFEFQTCEFGWDGYKTVGTFQVTGAGAAAEQFSDIECLGLQDITQGVYGYPFRNQYTVTFSAPVTDVQAWVPMGLEGTQHLTVTKADNEGLAWNIDCSPMAGTEGGFELHVSARDAATGLRLKGDAGDMAFAFGIFVSESIPDDDTSIESVIAAQKGAASYNLNGAKAQEMEQGQIYIQNNKKLIIK